jgi:peptidoglycan hydrolase-like protein with peptidoglycan-binding domain
MKHLATSLAVITVFAFPLAASAQSSAETIAALEAQVQALLQKVTQLQAQTGVPTGAGTGNVTATGSGVGAYGAGGAVDSSACPNIGRTLKKGLSGDDVRRLQQFLAQDVTVYPEGQVTGYYGALTEAAVRRWQAKYQVVSSGTPATTGYGIVGPRTAAAIALLCSTRGAGASGAAPVGGFVQVTPISGAAPLKARVVVTVNTAGSCSGATYAIDFGEGRPPEYIPVAAGNCNRVVQAYDYTYAYGGTYQISLSAGSHRTTATVQVSGAPRPTTPATSTPSTPPTTYAIVSVQPLGTTSDGAGITATFAVPPCKPYQINWGDSTPVSTVNASCTANDPAGVVFDASHTYTTAGTYTLELKDGTGAMKSSVGVSIAL